jgi:hypothetical protein
MKNKNYINWQKLFVSGKQNTFLYQDEVQEISPSYFFQNRENYNILKPIVDKWCDCEYGDIWGEGNAIDQLIPYQKMYNKIMNNVMDMCDRLALPLMAVEDGSVDADELAEEGLAPGKILIYRQGTTNLPQTIESSKAEDVEILYGIAKSVKEEMQSLACSLEETLIVLVDGNEEE